MALEKKELTKKQKIILCASTAAASILAAIGTTYLLILLINNPPDFVFEYNNNNYSSRLSTFSSHDDDYVYVPEAITTITPEQSQDGFETIIESSEQDNENDSNKIVVKNYKVDSSKLVKRKTQISVDYLAQNPELPAGSEITALTTLLNFYGYDITKTELSDNYLVKTIDKTGNFMEVYVGDPKLDGLGCYAKPIVDAANRYLSSNDKMYTAVDYSGTKFEDLLKLVESNTPVIIWSTTYNGETKTLNEPYSTVKWSVDGKELTWISPEHCMVLIGYDLDNNTALVSDPKRGIVEYDLDTVKARYLALTSQCVVLEKNTYVTGVDNQATYYTTQCVSVTENDEIKSVTLNNVEVDNVFLIKGNNQETHKIVITYLDGSTIEYVVYTKPITAMLDLLEGKNDHTVTEDDRNTIMSIKQMASSAELKYSKYSETEAIENILEYCDLMINKIDSAKEKLDAIKTSASKFEGKELSTKDITELYILYEDINELLSTQNLTNAQRGELGTIRSKCSTWLATVQPQ